MNFGIVTEFVFKLHPQQKTVFGGPLVYTDDKLEAIAQTIDKWYLSAGPKEALHCMMTRQEGMVGLMCAIYLTTNSSPLENFLSLLYFY